MSGKEDFAHFLDESTTPYNFCAYARTLLVSHGYAEVSEFGFPSPLPSKFFVIRDGKTLLAFNIGGPHASLIIGAHCDSPVLRLRPNISDAPVKQLPVLLTTSYGGGLSYSMCGRDLKLAGAILVRDDDAHVSSRVISDDKPIAIIPFPSNWSADSDSTYPSSQIYFKNIQPIFTLHRAATFSQYLSKLTGVPENLIVGHDLALVDSRPTSIISDFIASARIDNQSSSYAALTAFLKTEAVNTVNVCASFDNEEIGSRTRTGACSDLLWQLLTTIWSQLGADPGIMRSKSLFLAADVAHAKHPNYDGYGEKNHQLLFGSGIVLKEGYRKSFARDTRALACMIEAANRAGVKYSLLSHKNARGSGGTIGTKVDARMGIRVLDVGVAQVAMHSYRELVAWKDVDEELALFEYLYAHFDELQAFVARDL
jgi:aspartyl aminopeptidase